MNTPSSISRVIDLHRLLIKFHDIERLIYLPDSKTNHDRWETDTEHSYTLAMLAWYLAQNATHLDTNKCIQYALVHDLVEIYAGDTFAYEKDQQKLDSKEARELAARKKLQQEWPDFDPMHQAIESYELQKDNESRFVYALDKLQPIILNVLAEGKSWHTHKLSLETLKQQKKGKIAVSPEVAALYEELIAILETKPEYFG